MQEKQTAYLATTLWSIGKMFGGESYPIPEYTEYIGIKNPDTRTAQDIVNGLIKKLGD